MYPGGIVGQTPTMEEAEASHVSKGLRLLQARKAKEIEEAEAVGQEREKTKLLQKEPQAKLGQLTTVDAAAAQGFAEQRKNMLKESQTVALHLHELQSSRTFNRGTTAYTNPAQRGLLPCIYQLSNPQPATS